MQDFVNVCICDGGEPTKGPVLADLREPTCTPCFGSVVVYVSDELVEGRLLRNRVVFVGFDLWVFGSLDSMILFPYPTADGAETFDCRPEILGKDGCDLPPYARSELAAFARRGDANLEGPVRVGREKRERA